MNGNLDPKTRRSERHQIQMAVLLLTDSNEKKNRNEAFTVDLSRYGCRIEGSVSLIPGQLVQLLPSDSPRAAILGRVVWVGKPTSDLAGESGIEFLQPFPSMV
jgi:hypothetical protein